MASTERAAVLSVRIGNRTSTRIRASFEEILRPFERGLRGSVPELTRDLEDTLRHLTKILKKRHGNAWSFTSSTRRRYLRSRTGRGLKEVINSMQVMQGDRISRLAIRVQLSGYMALQETGGTMTPQSSQFLTIPLPAAMDGSGVPLRERAGDWDRTFVNRGPSGKLLIWRRDGDQVVPLYVLEEEVTVKPRLGLGDLIEQEGLPYFERRAFATLSRLIDEKLGR